MTFYADPALSVEEALQQADWFVRFALDRYRDGCGTGGADGRHYHPAVSSHAMAAMVQLGAAVKMAVSSNDQRVVEG